MSNNVNVNVNANLTCLAAQSATDEASSRSNSARDMMEAFNPMQLLNAMGEMLMQVLGAALSG